MLASTPAKHPISLGSSRSTCPPRARRERQAERASHDQHSSSEGEETILRGRLGGGSTQQVPLNSSRGSPHHWRTRCANALSLAQRASDGAYLEGRLRPSTQIDRGLIPVSRTKSFKSHCHLRGRKNSESLTIGRVKKLWTADDSAICRIDICGDPDSLNQRRKPRKKNPSAKRLKLI